MTATNRIFLLLESSKESQLAFAKAIGVSSGNVGDWKSGRSTPKLDAICKIADYFHVSTDYLLGRTDTPTPYSSDFTAQEWHIIHAYRQADARAREMVDVALKPFAEPQTTTPIVRLAAHGGNGAQAKELTPEQLAEAQTALDEIGKK